MARRYDAVLFDLLTALLDSWSLWNAVAGSEDAGRRWRAEYLRITYATGHYRAYEDLVGEAAEAVGLRRSLADRLTACYGEIAPWPEAQAVLGSLHRSGIPLGVVTNCSEALGRVAADRVGVAFSVVVTAERAGHYKPDPHRTSLRYRRSAWHRSAACSWRVPPMTCSAQRASGCQPGGTTVSAWRCRWCAAAAGTPCHANAARG